MAFAKIVSSAVVRQVANLTPRVVSSSSSQARFLSTEALVMPSQQEESDLQVKQIEAAVAEGQQEIHVRQFITEEMIPFHDLDVINSQTKYTAQILDRSEDESDESESRFVREFSEAEVVQFHNQFGEDQEQLSPWVTLGMNVSLLSCMLTSALKALQMPRSGKFSDIM